MRSLSSLSSAVPASLKLALCMGVFAICTPAQAGKPPLQYLSNAEFQQCLSRLQNTSKFKYVANTLNYHRPSQPDPSVIQSLNYQPEFEKDVWDYLSALVDQERVADGINAKYQWADVLRRIEYRYGVKAQDVLGVWGVESNFGKTMGKKSLIDSLATLSCFDRRQSYFRGEYANALRILQNGDIAAKDMTGSWAGAFGQTQFMPSTFLELAVDFDGDGRKDLVNSVPDALASTANFLANRGYRSGEPWGYEVKLPAGYWAVSDRRNKKPISYWRNKGFTLANGRPLPYDLSSAGLLLPAGSNGPAFLVGKNFDTFYSYNASESYALGIAQLSYLIETEQTRNVHPSNSGFMTAWPTDDAGVSRRQARDIQRALLNYGYDIGEVDGIIGDNTRTAIQNYQRRLGIYPTDGRAGQKFYHMIVGSNSHRSQLRQGQFNQSNQWRNQQANTRHAQQQYQQAYTKGRYHISNGRGSISNQPKPYQSQPYQQPEKNGYRRVIGANGSVRYVRVDKGNNW